MTGRRLSLRLARIEAATGRRLPLHLPLVQWSDAELCTLLGVPLDVSDDELWAIVEANAGMLTIT